jgi:hypothetical protein
LILAVPIALPLNLGKSQPPTCQTHFTDVKYHALAGDRTIPIG